MMYLLFTSAFILAYIFTNLPSTLPKTCRNKHLCPDRLVQGKTWASSNQPTVAKLSLYQVMTAHTFGEQMRLCTDLLTQQTQHTPSKQKGKLSIVAAPSHSSVTLGVSAHLCFEILILSQQREQTQLNYMSQTFSITFPAVNCSLSEANVLEQLAQVCYMVEYRLEVKPANLAITKPTCYHSTRHHFTAGEDHSITRECPCEMAHLKPPATTNTIHIHSTLCPPQKRPTLSLSV